MNDVYSVIIDNVKMRFILNSMSFVRHDFDGFGLTGKPFHAHTYYELLFALDDGPVIVTSSQRIGLKKNDFAVISHETLHATESSDCLVSIGFRYDKHSGKDIRRDLFSCLEECLNGEKRITTGSIDDKPLESLTELQTLLEGNDFISDGIIISTLLNLLFGMLSFFSGSERTRVAREYGDTPEDILRQTDALLNREFSSDIKAEDVADTFHISCKQLNRYFKNLYGLTFMQRRTELRLAKAKILLKSTDLPVKDISDTIGYNSVNAFYSAFKSRFGCSPETYKNDPEN